MKILDGKALAAKKADELKIRVNNLGFTPIMRIIQVGDHPASNKYIKTKINKAFDLGIEGELLKIDDVTIPEKDLIEIVKAECEDVDGLIIQLPLPEHINKNKVLSAIPHDKDIDGLSRNNKIVIPATPRGIISLLEENGIEIKGKQVAVVGQSNLVGKPVSKLLEAKGGIVSTYTKETGIKGTENADILVVAAGEANLIKKENIKPGVVIIDVGINEIADENAMKKIVGDVDRESVGDLPSAISPVPGGVGPMTVISLFENLIDLLEE